MDPLPESDDVEPNNQLVADELFPWYDHITHDADLDLEHFARRRSGIFSNENKEVWQQVHNVVSKEFRNHLGENTTNWKWLSIIEPSASGDVEIEVPELVAVCWLSVHGKLDISKLSPGVNYEVVFVAMFREDSSGWGVPVELWLELSDGQKQVQKVDFSPVTKSKWIEIHVGDFETTQQPGDEENEINFWLFEQEVLNWKKGLVIEGAIIRPKK